MELNHEQSDMSTDNVIIKRERARTLEKKFLANKKDTKGNYIKFNNFFILLVISEDDIWAMIEKMGLDGKNNLFKN
jgi:hypothetical protein